MIKNTIINLDAINSEYSFIFVKTSEDRYFCNCGEQFVSKNEEEVLELQHVLGAESDEDEVYGGIYKDIKLSLDKKINCPHCKKNYNDPDIKRKLIPLGEYFISGYEFQEDLHNHLLLSFLKI